MSKIEEGKTTKSKLNTLPVLQDAKTYWVMAIIECS